MPNNVFNYDEAKYRHENIGNSIIALRADMEKMKHELSLLVNEWMLLGEKLYGGDK